VNIEGAGNTLGRSVFIVGALLLRESTKDQSGKYDCNVMAYSDNDEALYSILRAVLGKSSVPFAGAPRELHADGVATIEDGEIDQVQRSWTGKIYETIE
jgi:hypothetical protein